MRSLVPLGARSADAFGRPSLPHVLVERVPPSCDVSGGPDPVSAAHPRADLHPAGADPAPAAHAEAAQPAPAPRPAARRDGGYRFRELVAARAAAALLERRRDACARCETRSRGAPARPRCRRAALRAAAPRRAEPGRRGAGPAALRSADRPGAARLPDRRPRARDPGVAVDRAWCVR